MNNHYNAKTFLQSICTNTPHSIASLSEILDIPERRLNSVKKLSKRDYKKMTELREMLKKSNCPWLR